jgi:hypothetical protein
MKVNLPLCFNWPPHHEGVLEEWRYSTTHSLTSVLDGGEWSASRPGRFTPRERTPGTHWIGSWVAPRAVLDAMVKRKTPSPRRESNPRTPINPARSPALYRLNYHGSCIMNVSDSNLVKQLAVLNCFLDFLYLSSECWDTFPKSLTVHH